ncbi:MAG: FAD-binding protein [Thermoanaerobaculales bacterium]|nr:FAD-binding protein [Thermoanaerobaculales bacterium]
MSAELTPRQRRALEATGCDLRFDVLTRVLYSTDASIYKVEPQVVAFPSSGSETGRLLAAAADADCEITPRGAGTGLAGGALGAGLIVDLARRNREIGELDLERRVVRVDPGVVLDRLNAFLRKHRLWFGPDVATASRATLGGMIANNSSGAHAPVYGTTADHVVALELALADGRVAWVGRDRDGLAGLRDEVDTLVAGHADEIARRLPGGMAKRWPGYGFDRALAAPGDLGRIVAGSEGTLAAITGALLAVVPRPERRGLGVLFFGSVAEAMAAAVEVARLEPAAVEHLDRVLLDQTRGQRPFAAARELLDLDRRPAEAVLLVELFDEIEEGLAALDGAGLGDRRLLLDDPAEQELVWQLRRAGLSLLTGRAGPAKPTACIEDVCVRPDRLPAYVESLRALLEPLGLEASFYGHAASGELHVRPVLDLHEPGDLVKLRRIADEVSALCRSFDGSIAAEHGVGIARTEVLEAHIGPELSEASRRLKRLFDPRGLMNPGKIVDTGRYRIDADLRLGAGSTLAPELAGELGFVDRDRSFVANLEQCNGCGGCLKATPTMCPTFIATGDEAMSTRGRANVVRAALEGRFGADWTVSVELDEVLGSCLACKACRTECPSNVDLAALKAELVATRQARRGASLLDRLIANADRLGRLGTAAPWLANRMLTLRPLRRAIERRLGLAADAPLPPYDRRRFDRWFTARGPVGPVGRRGRVLLWDDTWTRYHETRVGRAAVAVLEALGFEVGLVEGRRCCGRPAASRGLLGEVRRLGEHNLRLLSRTSGPIVFLEPSCHSVFVDEYRQLGLAGAAETAARCALIEDLVSEAVDRDGPATVFDRQAAPATVGVHGHCHAKALTGGAGAAGLLRRIPGLEVRELDAGCCGMAGAFGMLAANRELSRAVARPLVEAVAGLPAGAVVAAAGTSCRHQIHRLTGVEALHPIELAARRLGGGREPFRGDDV